MHYYENDKLIKTKTKKRTGKITVHETDNGNNIHTIYIKIDIVEPPKPKPSSDNRAIMADSIISDSSNDTNTDSMYSCFTYEREGDRSAPKR